MKNKFLSHKLTLFLIISSTLTQAQESNFSISGQYRVRTELRHGFRTLAADTSKAAFFISQRARLFFDYKNDKLSTKISIQDSRTWGDEEQKKDLAGLQVNELWVQLALSKDFALKMGRQELVYDDQRLLGNLDWGNSTISHDALLLKYENKEKQLQWHIAGAFNQSGEPLFGSKYTLKNYKVLGLAWLKKEINTKHTLSAIAIVNGLNATTFTTTPSLKSSITFGPLYNFHYNGWKLVLGGYYQTGKTENDLKLNAGMFNAYAEKAIKKVSLGAGVDYLSGNTDQTKINVSNNFSTLYPTNHKFYGTMDYFLSFPADTKGRGLRDAYVRLKIKASDKFTAGLDVHNLSLAHTILSGFSSHKNLGSEVDLLTEYLPSADISLQLGYSVLLATKTMEALKGGNKNNYNYWAFAMLKVSPVFFKHTFKN